MLRGKRYSLYKHEYLTQILSDTHPYQVFRKAAQVAISTTVLIKSLYVSDHLGRKVVYYFQDDSAVSDFSNDRCQTMIEESSYLTGRMRGINNVGLKQLGPGSLFFRGLFTRGKVKSIDCDFIVLDELDEAKPENVAFAIDRLMHSDLQWVCALSQPSVPGAGIDAEFSDTDQHFWHLICPSCGEYNCLELNFPDNLLGIADIQKKSFPEGATHYRGCKKCGARLNPGAGEWVAKYPSRLRRGYHLSQLYTQIKPPAFPNLGTKFVREYEDYRRSQNRLARFMISVLGFPYAGGNARVTDELLELCEGDHGFSYSESGAFMGVDQGDTLTITVGILSGGRLLTVHAEETEDWGRLDFLMSQFGVRYCLIDAQPNKHSAKAFCARYPGRASIQYFGGKELKRGEELHEGKTVVPTVTVDRTVSIDGMIDRMEGGFIALPSRKKCSGAALSNLEDVRRHLKNLVARTEETAGGLLKKQYLRGSIENHYGMSLNSMVLAAYELGMASAGPTVMPVFGRTRVGNA